MGWTNRSSPSHKERLRKLDEHKSSHTKKPQSEQVLVRFCTGPVQQDSLADFLSIAQPGQGVHEQFQLTPMLQLESMTPIVKARCAAVVILVHAYQTVPWKHEAI